MKKLFGLTLSLLLVASAVPLMAQAKPGHAKQGAAQAKAHRNRAAKQGQDADHQALKLVVKDCTAAQRLMAAALPIYQGHRHRGMEINKISLQVLRDAYRWNPNTAAKPSNTQQQLAQIGDGKEVSPNKYSQEQVRRSNELMKKALAALEKGRQDLAKVHGSYGGHIAEAGQLIDLSIGEVRDALNLFGRP